MNKTIYVPVGSTGVWKRAEELAYAERRAVSAVIMQLLAEFVEDNTPGGPLCCAVAAKRHCAYCPRCGRRVKYPATVEVQGP